MKKIKECTFENIYLTTASKIKASTGTGHLCSSFSCFLFKKADINTEHELAWKQISILLAQASINMFNTAGFLDQECMLVVAVQ